MKILRVPLAFKRGQSVTTVAATSCWHYGAKTVHEEGVRRFMERAKKVLWLHHGDMVEGITNRDKRYSHEEHTETLLSAKRRVAGELRKGKETCVGALLGNHDYSPSKDIGDLAEEICIEAGIPYLTATCYVTFEAETSNCVGFFAHGSGTASYRTGEPERKEVNRSIKVRDILKAFHADICGMGHMHTSIVCAPCFEEKLCLENDAIKRRPVMVRPGWYYAAPSMFLTYDQEAETANYAEMKIFPAKDLGWIEYDIDRAGNIPCVREVYETGKTKHEHYATVIS